MQTAWNSLNSAADTCSRTRIYSRDRYSLVIDLTKPAPDPKLSKRRVDYADANLVNKVCGSQELMSLINPFANVGSWSGGYIIGDDGKDVLAIIVYVENGTLDQYNNYPTSIKLDDSEVLPLHFTEGSISLC